MCYDSEPISLKMLCVKKITFFPNEILKISIYNFNFCKLEPIMKSVLKLP